jgi:phenylpyruvate tautomerase PptA (4-oxalocrotonate tautomerase family)
MPVVFIDAPPGLPPKKKTTLMKKVTDAVEEACQIGDTLIFLREHEAQNVSMNGVAQSENPRMKELL